MWRCSIKLLFVSHNETPHRVTGFWTSQSLEVWEINFYRWSHQVHAISLPLTELSVALQRCAFSCILTLVKLWNSWLRSWNLARGGSLFFVHSTAKWKKVDLGWFGSNLSSPYLESLTFLSSVSSSEKIPSTLRNHYCFALMPCFFVYKNFLIKLVSSQVLCLVCTG